MNLKMFLMIFLSTVIFSWFLLLIIIFSLSFSQNPSVPVFSELSNSYINSSNWAFGSFVINNSNLCVSNKGIKLLILVHSSVTHFHFRDVIRKHNVLAKNSKTIFLLGVLNDSGLQNLIEQESETYNDLVQGSFYDTYKNLTLKHILGLTWTAKFCSSAQLILKMDDDIFVNYRLLNQMIDLRYPEPKFDTLVTRTGYKLIACYIQHRMEVIRNTTSRWYVSEKVYSNRYYPDFCSGWAYITTVEVINDLLDQIPNYPLFWIDDVYITGILREPFPDIQLESLNKWFNVDIIHLYKWVTEGSSLRYKWRYIFSNANGDLSLLESALKLNQRYDVQNWKCCYPNAISLEKNKSTQMKPKNAIGFAKRIIV